MIKGGKDISHLPYEWQQIVQEVIGLKLRLDYGLTVMDSSLTDEMHLAIEAFQDAINSKNASPSTK